MRLKVYPDDLSTSDGLRFVWGCFYVFYWGKLGFWEVLVVGSPPEALHHPDLGEKSLKDICTPGQPGHSQNPRKRKDFHRRQSLLATHFSKDSNDTHFCQLYLQMVE